MSQHGNANFALAPRFPPPNSGGFPRNSVSQPAIQRQTASNFSSSPSFIRRAGVQATVRPVIWGAPATQRVPQRPAISRPVFRPPPPPINNSQSNNAFSSQRFGSSQQNRQISAFIPRSLPRPGLSSSQFPSPNSQVFPGGATQMRQSTLDTCLRSPASFTTQQAHTGAISTRNGSLDVLPINQSTNSLYIQSNSSAINQSTNSVHSQANTALINQSNSHSAHAAIMSQPELPVPDTAHNEDADLLEAMNAFDASPEEDALLGMIDLEKIQADAEKKQEDVCIVESVTRPRPIQRVVATSSDGQDRRVRHSGIVLRQPTVDLVFKMDPVILDDLPPNTQVPVDVVPLPGFDLTAGLTWLYPTNYPVRDYQFNIVQKALFKNTMVCLPTGLGKTFIAAVVIFNFYRWYPEGKLVFLAPTKPLVNQQMKACYSVMGIPQNDMVQMNGSITPERRAVLWDTKRVFFMTPQTAVNDLNSDAFRASDVKCLVIDEAHKATGGYAYCEIVRSINEQNKQFRVLALSATPGNDTAAIQVVLNNLLISHMEIRQEDAIDIQQYTHVRKIEKVLVRFDPFIKNICEKLFRIIIGYTDKLRRGGGIPSTLDNQNITKFGVHCRWQSFMGPNCPVQGYQKQRMLTMFMTAHSLLHAFELLQFYGMRPFYTYVHDTFRSKKAKCGLARVELEKNTEFNELINQIKEKLEEDLSLLGVEGLMDTSAIQSDRSYIYGHPKLKVLEEIVLQHFQPGEKNFEKNEKNNFGIFFEKNENNLEKNKKINLEGQKNEERNEDSRVMIFTSYRDSVQEITSMLRRHDPLIRVMKFVGHATGGKKKGLSQKEQSEVISKFRSGDYNVLVSTCVGEEGLDIGEVDLTICFDAQKSPLRSIQRTGRTGRQRQGKSIMLVSEGNEESKYRDCQSNKVQVKKYLRKTDYNMYMENPRMVPDGLKPLCVKLKLHLPSYQEDVSMGGGGVGGGGMGVGKKKSAKGELGTWLAKKPTAKETSKFEHKYLTDGELMEYNRFCKVQDLPLPLPHLPPSTNHFTEDKFLFNPLTFAQLCQNFRKGESVDYGLEDPAHLSLTKYPAFQIIQQNSVSLRHSVKSFNFVTAMTQLSLLSMREGHSSPFHFTEAEAEEEAEKVFGEESASEGAEPVVVRWLPKMLRRKSARGGKLSTLSTPEDYLTSQQNPPPGAATIPTGGGTIPPGNVTSPLGGTTIPTGGVTGVDETGDVFGQVVEDTLAGDSTHVEGEGEGDDVMAKELKSPSMSSEDSYQETAMEEDYNHYTADVQEEKGKSHVEGYLEDDVNVDDWATWNEDPLPPVVEDEVKRCEEKGEILVDTSVLDPTVRGTVCQSVKEMSVKEMSMNEMSVEGVSVKEMSVNETSVKEVSVKEVSVLTLHGALDFINRTVVMSEVPETPLNKGKGRGRGSGGEPVGFNLNRAWSEEPFGRRVGLLAVDKLQIDETLPLTAPPAVGPQSHSTPGRDRTSRKLLIDPEVSPVADSVEPPSSPSCIAESILDEEEEDEENEIPCSLPEEDVREGEEPQLNEGGAPLCRTPTDDSENDVVVRRRRKRPVAAFDTPTSAANLSYAHSVRHAHSSGSFRGTSSAFKSPLKPSPLQMPIKKIVRKAFKTPLEFVQDPRKKRQTNARLKVLDFVDDEAEVSDDAACSSDEAEEDETDGDAYPSSLIASQSVEEDPSYMGAVYAQHNMQSPDIEDVMKRLGPRVLHDTSIFSQEFQQDSDYGHDSFVAYSDEEEEEESPVITRKKRPAAASEKAPPTKGWNNDFLPPRKKQPKN